MSSRIIEMLEQQDGQYLSGETISKELGISRTAIWKKIKKLEELGYQIEASRRLGYRLAGKPSKLILSELLTKLKDTSFICSVKLLDSVDSTNNAAQQLAEDGAAEGTLVIAEQQTNGRGRMGRNWISPAGKGVWMSVILRPSLSLQFAPQLTLLTAVALCRALKELTTLDIGIKWPNDLLVDGKKISGILLESTAEDERIRYIIAGIGISVNLTEEDYPEELRGIATSLRIEQGNELDRTEVIAAFFRQFELLYTLYQQEGFSPIQTLWEALSVTLHKPVKLTTPAGVVEGTPIGLSESGALIVQKLDGSQVNVFSAVTSGPPDVRG
ncbi:biotin--[acetyl-CoA-carboxylase] ligase [Paenibacillus mendelii]|uniref:Bifunctional ligase/repressor BirA n=1 Tax=Paenibacillus mendelii TaxID=206163 RepID=A0ABV6JI18_9BACL|nr:biotin--[acetyl-CoA-carboxylase] ligase [Paenibacillus mendelii]MCQ6557999.1 biotin--[acetyl-CoA-carboxylase] ligase [Paenibacillus mendelii]